jgi:formamidopyrimidine-DNA glycosylase
MPELPDVVVYVEALTRYVVGRRLERLTLHSPFVLRTVDPPITAIDGRIVRAVTRIGKRIVLGFDQELPPADPVPPALFLVLHLMIAGRLRWREPGKKSGMGPKLMLASFVFEHGTLLFTEASSQKRASLMLVRGEAALRALDPGGVEPLEATREQFHEALTRESHTLKRTLTDPHLFSGIGNAYSDEILHAARLSPLKLSRTLTDEEFGRLYDGTQSTLQLWIERLRTETGEGFPDRVTAFRDGMAVHGRFKLPCPVCGKPVQRITRGQTPSSRFKGSDPGTPSSRFKGSDPGPPSSRFKGSDPGECNYCAVCQTNGRLLADRSLSRLLKSDWPKSIDEL